MNEFEEEYYKKEGYWYLDPEIFYDENYVPDKNKEG